MIVCALRIAVTSVILLSNSIPFELLPSAAALNTLEQHGTRSALALKSGTLET